METKKEESYKYGAKYCFDIITWNLKNLSCSSVIIVDNLTCFQPIDRVCGSTSIVFIPNKNELTFRCNFMQNFICTEIINKKKYRLFTIQEFMNHFIYFYSLIDKIMTLKPIQYCNVCLTPTYQPMCKQCYVNVIVSHSSSEKVPEKKRSKVMSWFRKK